jgi:Family of unknown function (DUF7019)
VPRFDDFQDYLYVSTRKALRMAPTRRPAWWRRIKVFGLSFGPAGATIEIDNAEPTDAIALLPELRRALDQRDGGIKDLNDPDLKVGQWFLADAVEMAYGIPGPAVLSEAPGSAIRPGYAPEQGPVLFAGRQGQTNLILGGSAEHLLDRRVSQQAPVLPGSTLYGLGQVLGYLHEDLEEDAHPAFTGQILDRLRSTEGFNWLMHALVGDRDNAWSSDPIPIPGIEPLTALARVLAMEDQERDDRPTDGYYRVVLGTPLYVAFHVPE